MGDIRARNTESRFGLGIRRLGNHYRDIHLLGFIRPSLIRARGLSAIRPHKRSVPICQRA